LTVANVKLDAIYLRGVKKASSRTLGSSAMVQGQRSDRSACPGTSKMSWPSTTRRVKTMTPVPRPNADQRPFPTGARTAHLNRSRVPPGAPPPRTPFADRGMPCRDREGEEALARLRNGEPELGHLVSRRHPALDRLRRDGAREHPDGSVYGTGALTPKTSPRRDAQGSQAAFGPRGSRAA
jgi:hypothetical protein